MNETSQDDIPATHGSEEYDAAIRLVIKKSPSEQARKFIDAAREAGTDDSEESFDAHLKRIATARLKASTAPKPDKEERDS